ncbi:helix-turn-helix domain-containing protein [Paenibacillus sp. Aloe-11]|uniref:helix-turn-helix domain-containing protein n=1 Tax=Paenibacillus sp. Aloe-11 TaxID=1050222 RepID=UPI001E3E50C5|nr:helix-turn-helix domain-containing protein [Paenibacillus sp. Aloe-11]
MSRTHTFLQSVVDNSYVPSGRVKAVCLSPSRLSHLFKKQVGDSIIETLIKYRLNQAEKLIKYTIRPITEIALGVGFNSPDYFSRKFTDYFGVNPSKYRKQQRDRVN